MSYVNVMSCRAAILNEEDGRIDLQLWFLRAFCIA